jgi:hypothetical protein
VYDRGVGLRSCVIAVCLAGCGSSAHAPADSPPIGCGSDSDCAAPAPYCEPATATCVACRFSSECSGATEVCEADACRTATSCAELHAQLPGLPSGTYTIDPDGAGGDAPLEVACDMVAEAGGWTIVFAATGDLGAMTIAYTSGTPRLLADASDVLVAYRDQALVAAASHATFALPDAWRTDTPFDAADTDLVTDVAIDGAAPVSATLRYGYSNFSSLCTDDWVTASSYGRICITGTAAPYFSRFTLGAPNFCSDSLSAYSAVACSDARRFSIAVR